MKQGDTVAVSVIAQRDLWQRPDFAVTWRPPLMALKAAMRAGASLTKHVTPNMLAAIAARETNGLNILQYGMPPTDGCGCGPWQVTSNVLWLKSVPSYPGYGLLMDPTVCAKVAAVEFLEPLMLEFPQSHLAAFAAFNAGGGAVAKEFAEHLSPDAWTTGHDYGTSVFANWINFAAVSFGVNVDWANYKWS